MEEVAINTAQKINELHRGLEKTMRLGIEAAVQIGELLTAKKAELKHGEFGNWVADNLVFSNRTARNYMRLYVNREWVSSVRNMSYAYATLAGENGNVSHLNKKKKDQATALSEQIDKICSLSDTLDKKILITNTALRELGIDKGSGFMVFNVLASFSNMFRSVIAMLDYFGIDFIAESQKPKTDEPAHKAVAAPPRESHTVDVEYEEVPPKTITIMADVNTVSNGGVKTIDVKDVKADSGPKVPTEKATSYDDMVKILK